jgi:hypothetical protein
MGKTALCGADLCLLYVPFILESLHADHTTEEYVIGAKHRYIVVSLKDTAILNELLI